LTGLLPDRETVLMRWRAQFGVTDLLPESLVAHVGEDVAGACQFVREDRLDAVLSRSGSLAPLADDDIAGIVRAAKQDSLPYDAETSTGRFSLAGVQVKFALQRIGEDSWALPSGAEPSTHIFKPAIPGLEDQDVTEVVSMRTASALGLPTAHAFIADFAGERVIAVERYDRVFADGRWWRVHQEDLCQAAGVDPKLKYESQGGPGAAACAGLIRQHCGQRDVETFARAIILNYLIKGSDAHARNYSVLITPGDVRLAPLYDLNATLGFGDAGQANQMAMRVGGEGRFARISTGNWRLFATEVQLPENWVLDQVRTMADQLPEALTTVCVSSDLVGVADDTLQRLQEQVEQWCRTARAAP
jgi:serine/threonine-protein kinase HipA